MISSTSFTSVRITRNKNPTLALQATHYGNVNAVALSPDNQVLVTVGEDWNVKLWDIMTGRVKQTLIGHVAAVTCVFFALDGKWLVSGSFDGITNLWEAANGSLEFSLADPDCSNISAISFSKTGNLIATAVGSGGPFPGRIRLWDVNKRTIQLTIDEGSESVNHVIFSANDELLFSGGKDGKIKVWNAQTGAAVVQWDAHSDEISSLTLSASGDLLATGSPDGKVKIWSTSSGDLKQLIDGDVGVKNSITFSPDGRNLVIGNSEVRIYDSLNGTLRTTMEKKTVSSISVFYTSFGDLVGSIGVETGGGVANTEVFLWNSGSGNFFRKMDGYRTGIVSVIALPDRGIFASANDDREIGFWSLISGEKVLAVKMPEEIMSLARSHNGKSLAVSAADFGKPGTIYILNTTTGKLIQSLKGHLLPVRESVFSSTDSRLISCSEDGTVKIWNTKTWQEERTINVGTLPVLAIATSNNSPLLFAGSIDGTVKVFNIESGILINTMKGQTTGVFTVVLSPKGNLLASGGPNTNRLSIWDLGNGGTLKLSISDKLFAPTSIRFLGDDELVVSNANGRVLLVNIESGKVVRELTSHDLNASSIATLSNGKYLLTASHDRTLHLVHIANNSTIVTFLDPTLAGAKPDLLTKNGEFLTIDQNGFYTASKEGERLTIIRIDDKLTSAKDLHMKYFRPHRINKELTEL